LLPPPPPPTDKEDAIFDAVEEEEEEEISVRKIKQNLTLKLKEKLKLRADRESVLFLSFFLYYDRTQNHRYITNYSKSTN